MKAAWPIVFVALLNACATATQVDVAEGQRGYRVDCSGDDLTWSLCYQEAGQICGPKGFEILDKTGGTGVVIAGVEYAAYGEPRSRRSLLVKCRDAQQLQPGIVDAQ